MVISHTGYTTKEIAATNTFLDETLRVSNDQMEEVVVIGYQTAFRKSVTTSIASVTSKDIKPYVTGNVANALQSKVRDLQVAGNCR